MFLLAVSFCDVNEQFLISVHCVIFLSAMMNVMVSYGHWKSCEHLVKCENDHGLNVIFSGPH